MTKIDKKVASEILNKIIESDQIVISRHKSPDPDAVGSQMAMKLFIEHNFKDKKVYAHGNEKIYDFTMLPKYDQITHSIERNSLCIVMDTANQARINGYDPVNARYCIKIDHHEDVVHERYGNINLVMSDYSSACEVLFYLIKLWQKEHDLKITDEIAKCLFCGMYSDTGGFSFSNTKPQTFEALSEITSYGFDYEVIVNELKLNDLNVMKSVGYAYQNIKIKDGVGYVVFDRQYQIDNNIHPQELSQVVNFMGVIREVKVWAVFNYHDNFIRVNLRSRKQYNVQSVAKKYDGGGHINASGAMIKNEDQIQDVLECLYDLV